MLFNIMMVIIPIALLSYLGYVSYRIARYQSIQRQRLVNRVQRRSIARYRNDILPPNITSSISKDRYEHYQRYRTNYQ